MDREQRRGRCVLVVDDEPNIRRTLTACLEGEGHEVTGVGSVEQALAASGERVFDIALVDVRLGSADGLDLIPRLLERSPALRIIVITAYASIETAVDAMRRGAVDYLSKPFSPDQVRLAVRRALTLLALERRVRSLEEALAEAGPEILLESSHPAMRQALETARRVAPTDATLLLSGPSGTGKTLLARAIHRWSRRAEGPLAVVSCPSLSPELLESELFGHVKGAFTGAVRDNPGRIAACEGGTLLLDEIADLPSTVQARLLRFLQEREYERVGDHVTRRADVRVIGATNASLADSVKAGRFREDLYYRLAVIEIVLPPLGERPDDVEALARRMLSFFAAQNHKPTLDLAAETVVSLRSYRWPGNARELRNAIERAVILCPGPRILPRDLPPAVSGSARTEVRLGDPVDLESVEKEHIRRVIQGAASLQEAARVLGIDQATLWRKRRRYGL